MANFISQGNFTNYKSSTYFIWYFFLFLQDCLTPLSMQALPDSPESLCIAEMGGTEGRDGEPGVQGRLYLNIGKQYDALADKISYSLTL